MKTLKEQISRKCIHFNGLQNKTCGAEKLYDEIDQGKRIAYRANLPCLKPGHRLPEGVIQCECDKCEFPSSEKIQTKLDEWDIHIKKMELAMVVANRVRTEHRGENWQGIEECPACKGRLHLSIAAENGHVWGKCETDSCVSWME